MQNLGDGDEQMIRMTLFAVGDERLKSRTHLYHSNQMNVGGKREKVRAETGVVEGQLRTLPRARGRWLSEVYQNLVRLQTFLPLPDDRSLDLLPNLPFQAVVPGPNPRQSPSVMSLPPAHSRSPASSPL